MKRLLSFLICTLCFLNVYSQKVDIETAQEVALFFINSKMPGESTLESLEISQILIEDIAYAENTQEMTEDQMTPLYYIFNLQEDKGFIIISADENFPPVLGFSYEGPYDKEQAHPPAFRNLMDSYKNQIENVINNNIEDEEAQKKWDEYKTQTGQVAIAGIEPDVARLVQTIWGQGCGYNSDCPVDNAGDCGHALTGCAATAMAQLMKYHNYPDRGVGQHSYTSSKYGEQSVVFENSYYNWEEMSLDQGNRYVAELMYHCGVSVETMYGADESGSNSNKMLQALQNYFNYSSTAKMIYRYDYNGIEWLELIKKELHSARPVIYSGTNKNNEGHAFICDGCFTDNTIEYLHFNWGWNGFDNGFYFFLNYYQNQSILIGLEPSAVNQQDLIALLKIFVSCNGMNWNNRRNWLNGNVKDMYGVRLENDRVSKLLFENNNLSGVIPKAIDTLENLTELVLSGNKLSGKIPDLSNLDNLEYLSIQDNFYTFADMAASGIKDDGSLTEFFYEPQADMSPPTIVYTDENRRLSIPAGHSQNRYQWYNNLGIIEGAIQTELTVEDSDAGDFYCQITNPLYPKLTLKTKSLYVKNIQRPTVSLSSQESNPTNSSSFDVSITFSEKISGFRYTDIIVDNCILGFPRTSDLIAFKAEITPMSEGEITIDINENVVADLAGNGNEAAPQFSIQYDKTAPTVNVSSKELDSVNSSPFEVKITFSEEVLGFEHSDITVGNGISSVPQTTDNIVFTTEITPENDGKVSIDIANDVVADLAGNGNVAAKQFSIHYDGTAPTVNVSSKEVDPVNSSPFEVKITFSEEVLGFEHSDITVGNGISSVPQTTDNIVFTTEITPENDGKVSIDIANDVVADLAGNGNVAAEPFSIRYDGTAPSVNVSSKELDSVNSSSFDVSITFSEEVSGLEHSDIIVGNGTSSVPQTSDNIVFTIKVTPENDGKVSIDIANDVVTDLAGNGNVAAEPFSIHYDGTAPSVNINSKELDPVNLSPFDVSITFSEEVSGLEHSDITVGNGISSVPQTSDNIVFTIKVTPENDGEVSIDIANDVVTDLAGNGNEVAPQFSIQYDKTAPTVNVSSKEVDSVNSSPFDVSITFSEEVLGFEHSDIIVGNGTSSVPQTSDNIVFTIKVTPENDGKVSIDIANDVVTDLAGNGNEVAPQFSIQYDKTAPTVNVSSKEVDPVNSSPFDVSITFSEEVLGFEHSDITVDNGISSVPQTSDNIVFTIKVTPENDGKVSIDIANDVVTDLAGNSNTAAEPFSIHYDGTAPSVNISSKEVDPVNLSPFDVSITFSEEVLGFEHSDITVGNGTSSVPQTTDNIVFTTEITPENDGEVTIDIDKDVVTDLAGNGNVTAEQFSIHYDSVVPSVSLSSVESNLTNSSPFGVTITFSEEVLGFELSDIIVGNGTSSVPQTTDNIVFTTEITPENDGEVSIDIANDVVTDLAGNGNVAAEPFLIRYDGTAPTVNVSSQELDPVNSSPFNVSITCSEEVLGFELSDITVGNGTASNLATTTNNTVFMVEITPENEGEVTVDISSDVVTDLAGNSNIVAEPFSINYDISVPTVSISSEKSDLTNSSPFAITITFSEEVTGFTDEDIVVVNGTTSNFQTSDNIAFTVDITPDYDGEVIIIIGESIANDLSGNYSERGEYSIVYDCTAPVVHINSESSSESSTLLVTFTFSEEVTDFEATDLSCKNGQIVNFTQVSNSEYTFEIIPENIGMLTVYANKGVMTDLANNVNEAISWEVMYTGIESLKERGISIYPIPAKEDLKLVSSQFSGKVQVKIYNLNGVCVYQMEFNSPFDQIINVSNLKSGIYLLQMDMEEEVVRTKIIITQ